MQDISVLNSLLSDWENDECPEVQNFYIASQKFQDELPQLLETLRAKFKQAEQESPQFRERCNLFLEICRQSINPKIEISGVYELLIQHILAEGIVQALFQKTQLYQTNNIAQEISAIIATVFPESTHRNILSSIEQYYRAIQLISEQITDIHTRQKFIAVIYKIFCRIYSSNMGINLRRKRLTV
ncbi:MAG: hypothetical protein ACFBSC_10060 [Microcoleaceae cyanobacterium]